MEKEQSRKGTSVSRFGRIMYTVIQIVNIGLAIVGFFVPPIGLIDGSVITTIGLLSFSGAFAMLPTIIMSGKKIHYANGNMSLSLEGNQESTQNA